MNRLEQKIEETMQHGGLIFWITTIVCGVGLYGLLWFLLALGVIFDL